MKLPGGEVLQLWVTPTGSKLWRLAHRIDGKQKKLAIGPQLRRNSCGRVKIMIGWLAVDREAMGFAFMQAVARELVARGFSASSVRETGKNSQGPGYQAVKMASSRAVSKLGDEVLEKLPSGLSADDQDTKAALLKAALGMIPIAGPVIAELIAFVVPRQRQDRFEEFALLLAERINNLEMTVLDQIKHDQHATDLFEEGVIQSLRALSSERKAYIASVVANGLSGDEQAKIAAKRLLKLLAEIDDDQIIILCSYMWQRYHQDPVWMEKHRPLLDQGFPSSNDTEATSRYAMKELAVDQLVRLGLLRQNYWSTPRDEFPRFDDRKGTLKEAGKDLTWLGRMLLNRVGLIEMSDS